IISGGNNDIERMQEIKEKSLLYEGLKHYFIVRFPQRPGALKLFVNEVLGKHDDITRFEFIKKTERESGPALVGIELKDRTDYSSLVERLKEFKFDFVELNNDKTLFEYLV
ncbi:MAG: threonine dehydratase, partial [Pedobacter sp.]